MKTLVITLFALAFLASCQPEEEKIIKSETAETTLVSLEFTFRDSGHVIFSDGINNEIDTTVFQSFNYEWNCEYGANLEMCGFNLDGFADSVVIIKLYADDLLDTMVVNDPFSNGACLNTLFE